MDQQRTDLFAAAHSLLRLALHIDALLANARPLDQHLVRVKHLEPRSPWIDAMNPDDAISGVRARTIEVAERLLAMARSAQPIDPRLAALVMQVVAGEAQRFSSRARKFAERYGVTLSEWVRDEPGTSEIAHEVMRAVNRITGIWQQAGKESGTLGCRDAQGGESDPMGSASVSVPPDVPCRPACA